MIRLSNKNGFSDNLYIFIYTRFFILISLVSFQLGCEDKREFPHHPHFLHLMMDTPKIGNIYQLKYPPYNYTSIDYQTLPNRYVKWTSVDSFVINHMGFPIKEPIINYTTFSREDGSGKQMIYLSRDFIGDTLMVRGCMGKVCEELRFHLQNE